MVNLSEDPAQGQIRIEREGGLGDGEKLFLWIALAILLLFLILFLIIFFCCCKDDGDEKTPLKTYDDDNKKYVALDEENAQNINKQNKFVKVNQ